MNELIITIFLIWIYILIGLVRCKIGFKYDRSFGYITKGYGPKISWTCNPLHYNKWSRKAFKKFADSRK